MWTCVGRFGTAVQPRSEDGYASRPFTVARRPGVNLGRTVPARTESAAECAAHERDDRTCDQIGIESVARLRLVSDDPVHQHRGRQAELLDVDVRLDLAASDCLAQEHGGEGPDLVASATKQVTKIGLDVSLRPARGDDGAPMLRLQALDEMPDSPGEPLARIGDLAHLHGKPVQLRLGHVVTHRQVELFLAREVPIQKPDADIRLCGDGRHCRPAIAAGEHGPMCAVQDALSHLGGVGGTGAWHPETPRL